MRIAFISYEYPPDTALGGIGTYARQAARILVGMGHEVEVFAGSHHHTGTEDDQGVAVHRVHHLDTSTFAAAVGPAFRARHAERPFDVLEGADYNADARDAVRLVPDIPLVVKLHTPTYLVERIACADRKGLPRLRGYAGSVRRGRNPFRPYDPDRDPERAHALDADEVVAPCPAIGRIVFCDWGLDRETLVSYPNPYVPSPALLQVPVGTDTRTVTFLGRLEVRKGVHYFAEAIPHILERHPGVRFQFVGASLPSPVSGVDMRACLQQRLRGHGDAVTFRDRVALDEIPAVLAGTDVCVFPSLWENFPNVCLEAMAAARGIVGSCAGGMADQLDGGAAGLLVPPGDPRAIAAAVIALLDDPARRKRLGEAARARVLSEYSAARVGALQVAGYERAIARRRHLGPRRPLSAA